MPNPFWGPSTLTIHDVEQNGEAWLTLRAGLPTASEFSTIVTSTGERSKQLQGYAAQLAAEKFAGRPLDVGFSGNRWTDRGHALEDAARTAYSIVNEVEVAKVGFVTNYGAGCSPDGWVGDEGLVEIKSLSPKHHVLLLDYYARHQKCPPDYVAQGHGQVLLCERQWNDVFFYSPDLPNLTVRLHRDDKFLGMLKAAIDAVNAERDRFLGILKAA